MKASNRPTEEGKWRYPAWDADNPADSVEGYYTLPPEDISPGVPARVPCTCDSACPIYCSGRSCQCAACQFSFPRFVAEFKPQTLDGDWMTEARVSASFGPDIARFLKQVGRLSVTAPAPEAAPAPQKPRWKLFDRRRSGPNLPPARL
jgi:hypothetical protein